QTTNIKSTELIPGRALLLTTKWHNSERFTLLNIYAPNDYGEHPDFWDKVTTALIQAGNPQVDFMVGDFNIVEEALDCSPPRLDPTGATNALRAFRLHFGLVDGWRHDNPTERAYTYTSSSHHFSCIDRIYTRIPHLPNIRDWTKGPSEIPSDHSMLSLRFSPTNATYIGPGRWTWPLGLLHDSDLLAEAIELGMTLQEKLQSVTLARNNGHNAQILWEDYKTQITQICKRHAKVTLAKINRRITQLKKDISRTTNRTDMDTAEEVRSNAAFLQ
ncbi:hypothetical protein GLOTRDRAFT_20058, partial [Gloeophyllum trabeum ATCC 11539]